MVKIVLAKLYKGFEESMFENESVLTRKKVNVMVSTQNIEQNELRFAYPDCELKDLIPEFLKNRRNEIPLLEGFLSRGEFENMKRLGHTLKGICASFGFAHLGLLGMRLEEIAEVGRETELKSLIEQMHSYLENVQVIFIDSP
jgi:HPt (histidine-containing phosphotransfer) domain-containing protein